MHVEWHEKDMGGGYRRDYHDKLIAALGGRWRSECFPTSSFA